MKKTNKILTMIIYVMMTLIMTFQLEIMDDYLPRILGGTVFSSGGI